MSVRAVYGRKGKRFLLQSINGYNNAARYAPWIVLVDLDRDCDCAPPCAQKWLARPSTQMCFRVAVRAVEAWLLADRERLAQLLGVNAAWLPTNPDYLDDPKRELIDLADMICASTRRRRCAVPPDRRPVQSSTVLARSRTLCAGSAGAAAFAAASLTAAARGALPKGRSGRRDGHFRSNKGMLLLT